MTDDYDNKLRRLDFLSNEISRDRSYHVMIWAVISAIIFGGMVLKRGANDDVFSIVIVLAGILGGLLSHLHQHKEVQRLRDEREKLYKEISDNTSNIE